MSITTTRTMTNWAGSLVYGAANVHRPASLDELSRLVARTARIRALGSGHSFSAVADTSGDLVLLDGLPPEVVIDPDRRTARVAAGMRYGDVAAALHRSGFALATMASLPHISVAGSCATGTHGSGDAQRGLAAYVAGLRLVGPDGATVQLSRQTHPDTFAGSVVAFGALGVVTHLVLDIEPTYEMSQRVHLDVDLDDVTDRPDDIFGSGYSVSVFTDWLSGRAMVWRKRRIGGTESGWDGGHRATRAVHPVDGVPPEYSTQQLDVPGPWHERLPHFRPELTPGAGEELQSEFFVPRAVAPAAFTAVREIAATVAPVLQVAELRTVRSDDLWLSPAYGRDSVTIHFTWIPDLARVRPVLAELEQRLRPFAPRPHWAKLTTAAGSDLISRYERAADFAGLMREYDPEGKFRNAFIDDLFPAPTLRR